MLLFHRPSLPYAAAEEGVEGAFGEVERGDGARRGVDVEGDRTGHEHIVVTAT